MKNLVYGAIAALFVACTPATEYNYFGEQIDVNTTHSYQDVYDAAQNGAVENVVIKGEITQTCAKKGCWMDVKMPEGDTMMVRFKDYGFFVPKEGAEGLETIMRGNAKMDTISVDMLRHYAEDAGKSEEEIMAITEPRFVLEFIADGVLIEKWQE